MTSDAALAADYPRLEDKYYNLHDHATDGRKTCESDRQSYIGLLDTVRAIYKDASQEASKAAKGKWWNPLD